MSAVSTVPSELESGPVLVIRSIDRTRVFDAAILRDDQACCVIGGTGTVVLDDLRVSLTGRDAVYELLDVSDAGWEDAEWR